MMTEKIKEKVQLPVWLLTLILSGLVGLFTYSIAFASNYAEMHKNVDINTREIIELKNGEIKQLQSDKADKQQVNSIEISLLRIEQKLDNYILINRK